MKLLSFSVEGCSSYGLLAADGVIDLHPIFPQCSDLRTFLGFVE